MQPEKVTDVDAEDCRNHQLDVLPTHRVIIQPLLCKGAYYRAKTGFTMMKVLNKLLSSRHGNL